MATSTANGASPQLQPASAPLDETESAGDEKPNTKDLPKSNIPKLVVDDKLAGAHTLPSQPRLPRPLPKIPAPKYSLKERKARSKLGHAPLESVPESDTRDLQNVQQQDQPASPVHEGIAKLEVPKLKPEMARRRSEHFERSFKASSSPDPVADEARNASMVLADVHTNVIINDEFLFATGLATFLAERYHRSTASTAVTLQHSACVFFAGSFDPTYIITVKAMSSLVLPTMNKRNIGLIQRYLERTLSVPLSRGFVRFVALPEDSFGTGGRTLQALVEGVNADRWHQDKDHVRHQRSIKALSLRRPSSRLAMRPKGMFLSGVRGEQEAVRSEAASPLNSARYGVSNSKEGAQGQNDDDESVGDQQVPKRKKSFLRSFLRKSTPSLADLKAATARVSRKEENSNEGQIEGTTGRP